MRLFGNIEAKTDAKGRVFLPATFRKVLQASGEESLVIRTDLSEQCLVLYPESVWNQRMDELFARAEDFDDDERLVVRQYVAQAEMVTLDGNGRFLIPKRMMQAAGIGQSVRFLGMNNTIEIWSAERTEQTFLPKEEFKARIRAMMKKEPDER